MDNILKKDCISFVEENNDLLSKLENKSVFITGATGLIGSHLVYSLIFANEILNLNIKIIAAVRSKERAVAKFFEYLDRIELHVADIGESQKYDGNVDYIIHGASVTDSQAFVNRPVDTIFTALEGTKNILDLAKEKNVKNVVYLSSLEVYGTHEEQEIISEDNYGYIDFTQVRSSYSEGKRMAECLCVSYSSQYDIPVSMARLTQTFGPGVEYSDNRVFAQFARSVIEGNDIVLHTKGETKRSYCYTKDAVSAIFYILLKGQSGLAYNIANPETYSSIFEMAELVTSLDESKRSKVKIDLKDISKLGYNPVVKINLQTDRLAGIGWKPTVGLREMYLSLISSMKNSKMQMK